MKADYDAIIIGASVAGSVCALTLAEKGWKVAVMEKRAKPEHYKTICTHIIHPSGVKTLKKLDVYPALDQASALPTAMELNYQDHRAYYPFKAQRSAANIERSDLDPALKDKLIAHPDIEFLAGYKLSQINAEGDALSSIEVKTSEGTNTLLRCSLLIGADGRNSDTVKLAGGRLKHDKNRRVAMFAYFNKLPDRDDDSSKTRQSGISRVWSLQRGDEYIGYFPNQEHDLVSWYISEQAYEKFKESKESAFQSVIRTLDEKGIKLGTSHKPPAVAKQTAPIQGITSLKGLALIGDAKLAADPLTGVGCSWAMESALLLCRCLPDLRHTPVSPARLRRRLMMYNVAHAIKYRIPSAAMTFMSLHGKWVFNSFAYPLVARITSGGRR